MNKYLFFFVSILLVIFSNSFGDKIKDCELANTQQIQDGRKVFQAGMRVLVDNLNDKAMKKMLMDANKQRNKLFGKHHINELLHIIQKYNEEIAVLAIGNAVELIPEFMYDRETGLNLFFLESSTSFLNLLLNNGFEIRLNDLIYFKNATGKSLKRIIQKEGKAKFFKSDAFPEFLYALLREGRMDFLRVLELNGFKLAEIDQNIFDIGNILLSAEISVNNGNDEMLNYVCEAFGFKKYL